jgi:hypothetical protein
LESKPAGLLLGKFEQNRYHAWARHLEKEGLVWWKSSGLRGKGVEKVVNKIWASLGSLVKFMVT